GDRTGFGVAVGVRAAIVARIGRRTAELHVHVGIARATRHHEIQTGGARGHGQGVVHRIAGGLIDAGDSHAVAERTAGTPAAATAAARTAHTHAAERAGDGSRAETEVGRRGF